MYVIVRQISYSAFYWFWISVLFIYWFIYLISAKIDEFQLICLWYSTKITW